MQPKLTKIEFSELMVSHDGESISPINNGFESKNNYSDRNDSKGIPADFSGKFDSLNGEERAKFKR